MPGPSLSIFLDRLEDNARAVTGMCGAHGIEVFGVSKAACGSPLVAQAMLRGGVAGIGESRLDNVTRLRRNGVTCPIMLLRIPSITEAPEVVRWCNISLNSEASALRALSRAAVEAGVTHEVVIMVEMGDRREGVVPAEALPISELTTSLPGLSLAGIGANFMCASGVLPSVGKLEQLARLAEQVEAGTGITLRYVSGGNSSSLPLLRDGTLPERINQLRVGCSLLLGENPWTGETLPGLRADAFLLQAELVELKVKPSLPDGERGADAFGNVLSFTDRGERVRGICNLGRLDMNPAGLRPHLAGLENVTASSDHMILDLTDGPHFCVGDAIEFELDYGSMVQAMMSPYVTKQVEGGRMTDAAPTGVRLIAPESILAQDAAIDFRAEMVEIGFSLTAERPGDPEARRRAAAEALAGREIPLVIGGERDDLRPLFGAMSDIDGNLGLLWMDARPDCDPAAGGVLAGAVTASDAGRIAVLADGCALVGLSGATRAEVEFIRTSDLLALTMEDVDLLGVREVMRRALERVRSLGTGFVLAFHGSVARGTGVGSEDEGLSYREMSLAMEMIAASGALRAVGLTGLEPGAPEAHLKKAFGYLLSGFGRRILGG